MLKGQSGSGVEFGASIVKRIEMASIDPAVLGFELRIEIPTHTLRTIHRTESAQVVPVNVSADREIHNGQVRY